MAFLETDTVNGNESLVRGCSFNDGYNVGIGVYGTNNLTIENNVVYHTVNTAIDLEGVANTLNNNLFALNLHEATFKVCNI